MIYYLRNNCCPIVTTRNYFFWSRHVHLIAPKRSFVVSAVNVTAVWFTMGIWQIYKFTKNTKNRMKLEINDFKTRDNLLLIQGYILNGKVSKRKTRVVKMAVNKASDRRRGKRKKETSL